MTAFDAGVKDSNEPIGPRKPTVDERDGGRPATDAASALRSADGDHERQ